MPTRLKVTSKPQNSAPKEVSVDQSLSQTVEQDHTNPSPLSHHLCLSARHFNLPSARIEINHHFCMKCTQILLTNLQHQFDKTKKERDGYNAFEKEVRKERARITRLDERRCGNEDREVETQRIKKICAWYSVMFMLSFLRFWWTCNDHFLAKEQQASQAATLQAAYATGVATLEKLERMNNDVFCIGNDGVFGTINGLHLGRVPGIPVSINFPFWLWYLSEVGWN